MLTVRACRVQGHQPGCRVQILSMATTVLDADAFSKDDLAQLDRARGQAARDLRSLKQTMPMDILRCQTPVLVRQELGTPILASQLIRPVMAQAARTHGVDPRSISFQGAVQTLEAFQPVIALHGEDHAASLKGRYEQLLDAIARPRGADRPGRSEPRRQNRRPQPYDRLMKPRHVAKREMLKGVKENYVPFVRHTACCGCRS